MSAAICGIDKAKTPDVASLIRATPAGFSQPVGRISVSVMYKGGLRRSLSSGRALRGPGGLTHRTKCAEPSCFTPTDLPDGLSGGFPVQSLSKKYFSSPLTQITS